jgi:U3 small nucleolar RNA-associated protein 12
VQQDKKGRGEVTEVTENETGKMIAVGYTDGSILLWNPILKSLLVTLNGHKSAVSALRFNKSGSLLASGSKDTNIILWDVISESGLFK